MTKEEREKAIAHGKEQLEVFGGEHAEFIKLAIEALEQEPNTWNFDDAREDFMNDVYNTLGFLPTSNEANRIIDSFDRVISGLKQEPCKDMGEVSDGYHTFNQLYYQRAILFATIVNQNKDIAWKSYKHSDGKYCFDKNGEWFIVGVDTPEGSYTYHYSKEYWDYFDCKELKCGKEWDGHTEEDVTRLLSLKSVPCGDCINRQAVLDMMRIGISGKELYKAVYALQPVTPKYKKGKWIESNYENMNGHIIRQWYCSECGGIHHDTETGEWREVFDFRYAYCPLCGAKMQEVET